MDTIKIDALGEQCPIPVVKTVKVIDGLEKAALLEVHVDNETAVENLLKMASSKEFKAKSSKIDNKHFTVSIEADTVEAEAEDKAAAPACTPSTAAVISSRFMGTGDDELGALLMKGFIYALSQLDPLPDTILLYNGGAYLSLEDSASLEDLKAMEARGVNIMTCGTCLDFYKIKDKLGVGTVTNMYNIVEAMNKAGKILRP